MDKTMLLMIEDDAFLSRIYAQKMEEQGFDVVITPTGEEGMKQALRQPPACILLDILLPGIDGFEVLEKLKAEPSLTNIPVIIISNLGQKEDVEKAMALGATGYLIKAHALPQDVFNKVRDVLKIG